MLLVAFLLVHAPNCHLSLVLAEVIQGDAVICSRCLFLACRLLSTVMPVKITSIEHIYDSRLSQKENEFIDAFTMVHQTSNAISS